MTLPVLTDRFSRELPEMAVPWKAAEPPQPRLLAFNKDLAAEIGVEPDLGLLTGTAIQTGVAQAYSGHQFGGYTPQLGDGRALLLGELPGGRDLHLKGSGRTPFSRGGDGLAVVGPMLREYVISEAMHALGIPTTRSLAVVATGRPVQRETQLPGAVLARVASSHLRVGSFQYARATEDLSLLQRLADHAIARHYPSATSALELFEAVISVQASLVAQWMCVGFVHGVMNTDNMTISGETIDYGPCAFMEAYDPKTVFSSIDHHGRYAYGNQPVIAEWNLTRLAEAMLPLFHPDEDEAIRLATASLSGYRAQYARAWNDGMRSKLGLSLEVTDDAVAGVSNDLLALMHESRVDQTTFFRDLAASARGDREPARASIVNLRAFDDWTALWLGLGPDPASMDRVNPVYVPRNRLVEAALTSATDGDMALFDRLLDVVTHPFEVRPGFEEYALPGADATDYQTFCGT